MRQSRHENIENFLATAFAMPKNAVSDILFDF